MIRPFWVQDRRFGSFGGQRGRGGAKEHKHSYKNTGYKPHNTSYIIPHVTPYTSSGYSCFRGLPKGPNTQ